MPVSSVARSRFRAPIWHSGAEKKDQLRPDLTRRKWELRRETGLGLGAYFTNVRRLRLLAGFRMTVWYLEALAAIALSLSVLMAIAWVVQQRTGNSGWVDTIWTFSVGLVGAGSALWPVGGRRAERPAMAGRGAGGDLVAAARPAYRGAHRGHHRRSALCRVRQRMGRRFAAPDVHLPAKSGVRIDPAGVCDFSWRRGFPADALRLQDYLGALILFAGIAGEALADAQLKRFRDDPANKGRVCDVGLWRWSRHPNYFFEWFGWLAYPVIAISPRLIPGAGRRLLAPVFMYWILVHVTGIPPLEAQMLRSRGERYRDYQSRTSVFFPLPPHERDVVT